MYEGAEKIAGGIAAVVVLGILAYQFAVNVLPWLILIAVVGAAIFLYFWQRSTRRSPHPWE
jgi:hypothetical protein